MADLLLRGRTLSFLRWPDSAGDSAAYRFEEDGAVLVRDGKIAAVGGYADVARQAGADVAQPSTTGRISSCRASSTRMCISRRCR